MKIEKKLTPKTKMFIESFRTLFFKKKETIVHVLSIKMLCDRILTN